MDLKDTEYFDQLQQLNNAYRISRFRCTDTKKWQRTLDNKTTLNFGRYTSIEPIANDLFPEHYFNFIAYNEVQSKADLTMEFQKKTIEPAIPRKRSSDDANHRELNAFRKCITM
ncbi:hypothetical protein Tco_1085369, partial [Tanacetum coccineum]